MLFRSAVDPDGQVLLVKADEARLIDWEHVFYEVLFENFIKGQKVFVEFFSLSGDSFLDRNVVSYGVLHKAIYVHGHDTLATSGNAARTEGKGESIFLHFVAKPAIMGDHTIGEGEVRFVLVIHLETVNGIMWVVFNWADVGYAEIHTVVDNSDRKSVV